MTTASRASSLLQEAAGEAAGQGLIHRGAWGGALICPCVGEEDRSACLLSTCCPCAALGLTYRKAFNLPGWSVPVHAVVYFFCMSAMWIAAAAIHGSCSKLRGPNFPMLPPGISPMDVDALMASNFTLGANGANMTAPGQPFANRTYAALFQAQLAAAQTEAATIVACDLRMSPTVGGVSVLTIAFLAYGAARRWRLRRVLGLPGSWAGDVAAWAFCTQCAICQEHRTAVRRLDGGTALGAGRDGVGGTRTAAPAYVEMSSVAAV